MSTKSFTGVKRAGRDADNSLQSRADVKQSVQLYLYSPPPRAFMSSYSERYLYLYLYLYPRDKTAHPEDGVTT
jgi:hypothetical protein